MYRESVPTSFEPEMTSRHASQVDERVAAAKDNYRRIVGASAELMRELTTTAECSRAFGEARNHLNAVLPEVEARLASCKVCPHSSPSRSSPATCSHLPLTAELRPQ